MLHVKNQEISILHGETFIEYLLRSCNIVLKPHSAPQIIPKSMTIY